MADMYRKEIYKDGVLIDKVERPFTDEELLSRALRARKGEYGSIEEQLEFITENGLEAWQLKVASIKTKHPKPTK